MAITIAGYSFDGPYSSTSSLEDRSGVYAILCKKDNDNYSLVDVGEAAKVKSRVETHDRKSCWSRNCHSTQMFTALYTPHLQQSGRIEIEQKIRAQYNPTCGER